MAKISRENRRLFVAVMVISMMQMAFFAPTPGIAKIKAEVFTSRSLADIQTAMMLPSLTSMIFSIVSAALISKKIISKKAGVVIGLTLMALTGIVAPFAHGQFWQLQMYSVLIGAGMGFFIAPLSSIMFDNFSEAERQLSVGVQTVFINGGGIILSVGGGLLAQYIWFGGYLMMLLAIPCIFISLIAIPGEHHPEAGAPRETHHGKFHLPLVVFYYGIIGVFFGLTYNVCGTNISTHLASYHLGNTATAGVATAVQLAGGVAAGLVFSKLSAKIRDYTMSVAFLMMFAGYLIISIGHASLTANMIGVFISGGSVSIVVPQILFSTSNHVGPENSAAAMAIVNSIMPGIGGYLSPIVFTNVTTALGGESTSFRFAFVAFTALAISLAIAALTYARAKKECGRTA